MCLILIAWKSHPQYPVIVAANRDEYYDRPSVAAHFWKEAPSVLAGRDLRQGGSWLGIDRDGRFAGITNFRGGETPCPQKRSRGELVAGFLISEQPAAQYSAAVAEKRAHYNPFNLITGDSEGLYYCDNTTAEAQPLPPGVYALGNNRLHSGGAKEAAGVRDLRAAMFHQLSTDNLLQMLRDDQPNFDGDDPLERGLSSRFIHLPGYGTRASTALLINQHGEIQFAEQNYNECGTSEEQVNILLEASVRTPTSLPI